MSRFRFLNPRLTGRIGGEGPTDLGVASVSNALKLRDDATLSVMKGDLPGTKRAKMVFKIEQ